MTGYYRKFVKNFGILSKPLTQLLKKGAMFVWTVKIQQSFEALKQALVSAPVLALPNFQKQFCIEVDASDKGIGAVLQQKGHPIAFISKALGPKHRGLSTYEKECLAILFAVEQWRPYLQQGEFIINTDQRSLIHLDDQRLSTPWQHKALTKLLELQFKIVYRKGVENSVADALSRMPRSQETETLHLIAMSVVKPVWLEEVISSYQTDATAQKLITDLTLGKQVPHFTFKDGLLRYKNRIWFPRNENLLTKVLSALHTSAIGGHSGFPVTYKRVKALFAWPQMKESVKNFVDHCLTCQQAKPDRVKYPGLLQPLPIADRSWQAISMDFIEGLPKANKYSCILVVVDTFSKYAHFIPLAHPYTSLSVAMSFMNNVYKLHGLPEAIISDRDKVFTSNLWKELFRLSHTQLKMSSAYHPQTDGQTECVNQCLETYLRCFVQACPKQWIKWLSLAEFWYNTCYHSSTGKTPFEVWPITETIWY